MKIESNKLQKIFKYLTPSIGSPLKMPEFNSFLFDANESELMVRIDNGTTESIVTMSGKFEPIRFAVDEFIYQIVNQLNGEITFELDDTNLIVDCGAKHYEFSTIDCELWKPRMPQTNGETFNLQFVELFNKVRHAIATDESRPAYCNYHIRDGQLFTSDGFRAITIPISLDDYSFPQKEFDSILRCLDGSVKYNFGDTIYFECEIDEFTIQYCTGKANADEPFNCKKIFMEKESIPIAIIIFDNLQNELKDILVLQKHAAKLGDSGFLLTISIEPDNLYFITNIQGLSDSKQKIDCEMTWKKDFEIYMNPSYLMDFAKIATGAITMKILDESEPILLQDDVSKSLLMPMQKRN